MRISLFLILLMVMFPPNAYAYLDPASGNALFSAVIALIGTGAYLAKSIFYRFTRGSVSTTEHRNVRQEEDNTMVIFSEGKAYWGTFRPIIAELIHRKISFRYFTLDAQDPALRIDNKYMRARRLSKGMRGFAVLNKLSAPVMLATTPNIGTAGYPLKRSSSVAKLVHVFHAMNHVFAYRKGSLDHYDSVVTVGDHEKKALRIVEQARGIPKKELISLGLPYLDDMFQQIMEVQDNQCAVTKKDALESKLPTVLVAPSWGRKGCFTEYGVNFVKDLSKAGFPIIIRLHPHSYVHEAEKVKQWKKELSKFSSIFWDEETFSTNVMKQSDILISDTSSVRYDYAFLSCKPVITLDIPSDSREAFESSYFTEEWDAELATQIGVVITKAEVNDICSVVKNTVLSFSGEHLNSLRKDYLTNFGKVAPAVVSYLGKEIEKNSLSVT